MNRLFSLLAFLLCGLPCFDAFAQSATVENLSYLNFNNRYAVANGVSPDGQTVTGQSIFQTVPYRTHAFRWTPTDPIQSLGALSPASESASAEGLAISANGIIVGTTSISASESRAFRLGSFGGMQALASYGGPTSTAYDVSDDASVIVGSTSDSGFRSYAVRWTGAAPGTITPLGTIGNVAGDSNAYDCSADGSVVAGTSWTGSTTHACLFRNGQPPLDLGALGDPAGYSVALGISSNGVLVVGYSYVPSGPYHAMYWKQATGMVDLGVVDGVAGYSFASAVSASGRLIVGNSNNNSRPGGQAAVWIDEAPRQLWDLVVNDYDADVTGWTSFDHVNDVSRDGSVLIGYGTHQGASSAFRITLRQNKVPTVAPPTPVSVECNGGVNTVVLSAQANDADPTDRLTVTWGVGGVVRQTTGNVVPGSSVTFSYNYPDGETPVWIGVSDGKVATSTTTKVTVVDTKSPIVVVSADIRKKVDRGEVFASNVNLGTPFVDDVCDPAPKLTNDAKTKYPIGTTKVTWTVQDKEGNVAKAVQRVIVKNDPPVANAGSDVTVKTTEPSVTVKLNGSLSRDPNGHKLKYLWKAPGAKLTKATSARPTGVFKVGTTRVSLTVTDEAGAKSTDLMTVKIRAARVARTAAMLADASVRESQMNALDSYQRGRGDSLNAEGLSLAALAYVLGAIAGDDAGANADEPVSPEELTSYLTLRATAAQQARMAGDRFYESFVISGDENSLAASMYAYYGSGLSLSDLSSDDVHEALIDEPQPFGPTFEP